MVPGLFVRITICRESIRGNGVTGSDPEVTGNFHISFMDVCLIMIFFLNLDFWVFLVFPISHNNITLYSECHDKRNLHLLGYRLESQESCVGWLGSGEASSSTDHSPLPLSSDPVWVERQRGKKREKSRKERGERSFLIATKKFLTSLNPLSSVTLQRPLYHQALDKGAEL